MDVIIPVYNEGENIGPVLDTLLEHVKTPIRILICYDHDQDTTLAAIASYPRRDELVIEFVKNEGAGVRDAIVSGIGKTSADAVLVLPGDDTFNAPIIDDMYKMFLEGADIVSAARFMEGGCMEGCPWLKATLVRLAAFSLYHFASVPTHDPTSGFKLFSRKLLESEEIESQEGWSFALELVAKCHRRGGKIVELPAKWYEREHGKSRFKVLKWLPVYLRWYFFAFKTAFVKR